MKTPRVIAIGDIHGSATALGQLIEHVAPAKDDTIVVLGDVVDRGTDSRGVIEQLLTLQDAAHLVCLLGNHEQMMLEAVEGEIPVQEWLMHGGAETLDSYGKGAGVNAIEPTHLEFIRTWGDVFETDTHIFVHGNYIACRPLDRQPWADLRWQSLHWHTPGPHFSGKTVVLGHTSNKQGRVVNLGHLVCIDTYCCGGYWLTGFDVTSGRIYQCSEAGEVRTSELPPIQSAVGAKH